MHWSAKISAFLLSVLLVVVPAQAQQSHVIEPAELEKALEAKARRDEESRDAILRLLRNSEVERLAERLGLDIRKAEAAVSTLDGEELVRLASEARRLDSELIGGKKITVSTETIIIGLLVLILIIVAVD